VFPPPPKKKKKNFFFFRGGGFFSAPLPGGGGGGGLDDSSRLDVVEIARVPDMLQSFFPYWLGEGLISTLVKQTFGDLVVVLLKMWRCGARVVPDVVKVKGRSDFIIRVLNC